jgi:bla regulator protein BlaR1
MIGELMNHLWQSTLFAVAAWLLTIAFRKNRAHIRYWLWLAASLKFLVLFSLLISLGSHLELAPAQKKMATQAVTYTTVQIAQPFPDTFSFVEAAPHSTDWPLIAILGMWVCGFGVISLMRFRTWLRIRAAVRSSTSLAIPGLVEVRSSAGLLEPGVAGLFQPLLLLPEGIVERLTPAQLEAVLAHELCHVRRRDNLTAAIHMVVEALFWFHPLVWWIGVELVKERERACDEDVLRLGSEPQVYAEGILSVCKFYVESPLKCVAGVTGPNLRRRVELIMRNHVGEPLNTWRKLLLATVGVMAVALPVVLGLVTATPSRAQSQAQNNAAVARVFDSASIKPNKAGPVMIKIDFPPDGFTATAATLQTLIQTAYKQTKYDIGFEDNQISGAPGWVTSEWYDVAAKVDSSVADKLRELNEDCSIDCSKSLAEEQPMLQALLEDRFKLKLHRETKELPVYSLVIAKTGPKLQEAKPGDTYPNGLIGLHGRGAPNLMRIAPGLIIGQAIPVSLLAHALTQKLGDIVVDKTGLKGKYDFTLQWTPEAQASMFKGADGSQGTASLPDSSGPSILAAIQEQLGLRLEPQKAPMEILVIDHVEAPSEN